MKKFFICLALHFLFFGLCYLCLIASNTNSGIPLALLVLALLFFDLIICPIIAAISKYDFFLYNFFAGGFLLFLFSFIAQF